MPGEAAAIAAVAELLSKLFGWAVDPTGMEQLTLDNKLKLIARGMDEAIAKGDWVACDELFARYRELRREQSP
jgi:hypothetical protein